MHANSIPPSAHPPPSPPDVRRGGGIGLFQMIGLGLLLLFLLFVLIIAVRGLFASL